jgi:hypothetical protein
MEYTDATLDALRLEGDPLADDVISTLAAAGEIDEVNRIMRSFQTVHQPIPDNLPPIVRQYLQDTETPPAWLDYERVGRVQNFFLDDGLLIAAALSLGAMVDCYAIPHGAKLLTATHRLDHPRRRITETGQFCVYMMSNKAFSAGAFIPSIQKVRLIHAGVRYLLRSKRAWDETSYGVPICQEDMLGALMFFSSQVLQGLRRLGLQPSEQDAEDYYYVWRVTGVMLGIREDIIPPTLEEAHALNSLLKKRHIGYSPEGVELTRDLLDLYEELTPGHVIDGAVPAIIRQITEDEIADLMAVPRSPWDKIIKDLSVTPGLMQEIEKDNALARRIVDKLGWLMINTQMRVLAEGEKVEYEIPTDLHQSWQLDPWPQEEPEQPDSFKTR